MKFTIVTPSLNQAAFIARTIGSVRMQRGEFSVEHIVVDACSTDGTQDVVAQCAREYTDDRYELVLISEPDDGQSDAINKGLRRATGDMLSWLNADDEYEPGAFERVAALNGIAKEGWCFGNCRIVDADGGEIRKFITWYKQLQARRYSYRLLLANDFIPQPAVFFSRALYERVGEVERRYHLAMDYDYWLRLGRLAEPVYIDAFLARFRWLDTSKSGTGFRQAAQEALAIARQYAPSPFTPPLLWHALHCRALGMVYRLLQ